MEDMIRKIFSEKRIRHGAVKAMATPRRLCLYLADVAGKQEDQLIEKLGPAKRVAFDENGNPSKALAGFARGQGMEIADLITVTTEKGEYLCARKMIAGEETKTLLPDIFMKFIPAIPLKNQCAGRMLSFVLCVRYIGYWPSSGRDSAFRIENDSVRQQNIWPPLYES